LIYANRIIILYGGKVVADGSPAEVLEDEERLKRCRILPTSLLHVNKQYLPQTGRFVRAETLAHFVS